MGDEPNRPSHDKSSSAPYDKKMEPPSANRKRRWWLHLADQFLVIAIVSPLVVGYWRGTWQLFDIYLFPSSFAISAWISFAVGTLVPTGFVLAQSALQRLFRPDRSFLVFFYASRLYSALFALTVVNHWRGVWQLLDHYTGKSPLANGAGTLVGALGLAYWRGLRNVLAAPLVVVVDSPRDYFAIATRFKQQSKGSTPLEFALDAAFSVFVLGSLVVFVWRGAWGLLDVIVFPDDRISSAWCSLFLGFTLSPLFLALQGAAALAEKPLGQSARLVFEDCFVFLANLAGPINVWRGCWMLLDTYLYPGDYETSNWVTHAAGFVLLLLMYCVNSILVRGVCVDGDGTGCRFENEYLQRIFRSRWEQEKELAKEPQQEEQLMLAVSDEKQVTPLKGGEENGVRPLLPAVTTQQQQTVQIA